MDWDQEIERQWKVFHKTLDGFPHTFQLENQDQLTVRTCKKALHTVQSDFNAGLATPLERARTLNMLCFLRCQLGERPEALEHVQQALREDGQSKNIVSRANKAVVLWHMNLCERAMKQVEDLKGLMNDNDFEYSVLCAKAELAYSYTCLGGVNFWPKAVVLFSEVIKGARESEICLWTFGVALTERRALYHRSVPLLSNTDEDDRRSAVLKMYLDIIKRCRCDKLRAKAYVEVAHLIDNLWGRELQKQMVAEAGLSSVGACNKAIELDPDDPSVLWKSGKIFRHNYQLGKSYTLLKKSTELKPTTTAFHQLGLTCRKLAIEQQPRGDRKNAEPGRGQFRRGRGQFVRGRGRARGPGGTMGGRAEWSGDGLEDGRFGRQNDRDAKRGGGDGGRGRWNGRRIRGGDRNERWGGGDLSRGTGEGKRREGRKHNKKETGAYPVNQPPEAFQRHPCQSGRSSETERGAYPDVSSRRRGRRAGQVKGRGGRHSNYASQQGTQRNGHSYATDNFTSCYSSIRNQKSPNLTYAHGDCNSQAYFPDNFIQTYNTLDTYYEMPSPEGFNQVRALNSSSQSYSPGFFPGICVQVSTPDVCYQRPTSGILSRSSSLDFCHQQSASSTCEQRCAPGSLGQRSSRGIFSQTSSQDTCNEWSSPDICSQESAPDMSSQQSTPRDNTSRQSASGSHGGPTVRDGQQWDPKTPGADLGACGGSGEITDLEQKAKHSNHMQRENDGEYTSYDSGFETGRWEDDFSRLSLSNDSNSSLVNCKSPYALSSSDSTLSHNQPANSSRAPVSSPGASINTHYSSISLHEIQVSLSGAQLNAHDVPVNPQNVGVNPLCTQANPRATDNRPVPRRWSTLANLQGLETSMAPSAIYQGQSGGGNTSGTHRRWSHGGHTPSNRDINLFKGSLKTGKLLRFDETDDYVQEAIAAFEQAVRLGEHQNVRAMIDLGLMYRGVGRLAEALQLFECIVSIPGTTLEKLNAYEQAGLTLKDISRQYEGTDEEKRRRLVEEGEGKLRMALQLCSMLCRRRRELTPFIPHVFRSFDELLQSVKTSNATPVEKNRMIARLFQLIENHQESMNVLRQIFNQNQREKTNPETLKIKINGLVGLGQYDEALEAIGLIRVLDERSDEELFGDRHFFVRVNMQAGRDELSAVAKSGGHRTAAATASTSTSTTTTTTTTTATTTSTCGKAGFYFSAAFTDATATALSESQWETSSSEGSETGSSIDEEDKDDDQERWDVMVLHQENLEDQAQHLARALREACGLRITVNDDDCVPGRPALDTILWVMARSRQVMVVLPASEDRRGRSDRERQSKSATGIGKGSRGESYSEGTRGESGSEGTRGASSSSGRADLQSSGGRDRGRSKSGRRKDKYFELLLEQAALRRNTVVLVLGKERESPSHTVPRILATFPCIACPPRLAFRGGSSDICGSGSGGHGGNCDDGGSSHGGVGHGGGSDVSGRGGEGSGNEDRLDFSDPMVQEAICELFSFLVDVKFEQ